MKKYTQEEFDNLPIVDGFKICPKGDYSEIKKFGDGCKFGNWCKFEKSIKTKNYPFYKVGGFGSRVGSDTYFFDGVDGIYIRCGCFFGNENEFIKRVKNENSDKFYLEILNVIKNKIQSYEN